MEDLIPRYETSIGPHIPGYIPWLWCSEAEFLLSQGFIIYFTSSADIRFGPCEATGVCRNPHCYEIHSDSVFLLHYDPQSPSIPFIFLGVVHCVSGESILCQKYAFIKKSTILSQSLRNFVKMRYS